MISFQEKVARFVGEHNLSSGIEHRVLDLVSEIGELSKEVLKSTGYGRDDFKPTQGWEGELGDVLFSLACVANLTGVDLETALEHTLEKYRNRLEKSSDVGSGA